MRIGQTLGARLDWYDRGGVVRNLNFFSGFTGLAPAGVTTRWTYTVPAGKKFFLQAGQVAATRLTVAAPAGGVLATLNYTPNGGGGTDLLMAFLFLNTVGAQVAFVTGSGLIMLPGDRLEGQTTDASTGGTVTFQITAQGIEYDA